MRVNVDKVQKQLFRPIGDLRMSSDETILSPRPFLRPFLVSTYLP